MKNLRFIILCIIAGIVISVMRIGVLDYIHKNQSADKSSFKLTSVMIYDKQLKKDIIEMQSAGINIALYSVKKDVKVLNEEFNRSSVVKVYRIAGNSAVLFENSNAISYEDISSCIIGRKTALSLFGSVNVTGRFITMGEKKYQIAGIEHTEDNAFVYEADIQENEKMSHAACAYKNKREKFTAEQTVKNFWG